MFINKLIWVWVIVFSMFVIGYAQDDNEDQERKEIETEHLTVTYDEDIKNAKDIADRQEKVIKKLIELFGDPEDKLEIHIYSAQGEYQQNGGHSGYLAYCSQSGVVALLEEESIEDTQGEIAHELVHLYLAKIMGGRFYSLPIGRGLDEGLAEYFRYVLLGKGEKLPVNPRYLWLLIKEDNLWEDIEELLKNPTGARNNPNDRVRFAYAWGFVYFLLDKKDGKEILKELVEKAKEGDEVVSAFEEVLGARKLDFDKLSQEWIKYPNALFERYLKDIEERQEKKGKKLAEKIIELVKKLDNKSTEDELKKMGESALPYLWKEAKGKGKNASRAEEMLEEYFGKDKEEEAE
jgi:Mor family transcriptional regulator